MERTWHADSEADHHGFSHLHVVVEAEVLALNLRSETSTEIDKLRRRIEHVAYNGHGGYVFQSVRRKVPKPYLHAIATLDAIRRGADLRGSGGEPKEVALRLSEANDDNKRPFVGFDEAFSIFDKVEADQGGSFSWLTTMFQPGAYQKLENEKKRVFLSAVQLHEAQGAILLTRIDGGEGQDPRDDGSSTSSSCTIHVNPAWFVDLVRRVVDIRLLEPAQQEKVAEAIEAFAPAESVQELTDQHMRFFQGGEVSREYLKFLWLRDMKLGPASQEAVPLVMSEEGITAMVGALVDVRFMFPVRDENGGVVPDRYVVASCLPERVGGPLDPGDFLGLQVQGALFSTVLKVIRTRFVPPGLIPRLLAWCGRGEGRITAAGSTGAASSTAIIWCCCTRVGLIRELLRLRATPWGVRTTRRRGGS